MPEFPPYQETVTQSLTEADLFTFSPEVEGVIDEFHSLTDTPAQALEQSRALSHLHAAEYALFPAFADPGVIQLPPVRAITVSASDARIALLKGDCSMIIWTHIPGGARLESLRASDLTVFSGDASKVRYIASWENDIAPNTANAYVYAEQLQSVHEQSNWAPALRVAESGVIRLQGLLWYLKSAVVEYQEEEEFREMVRQGISAVTEQLETTARRRLLDLFSNFSRSQVSEKELDEFKSRFLEGPASYSG